MAFLTNILKKIFKPKVDKTLKKIVNALDNDPELRATLKDMEDIRNKLNETDIDYCKKRPQSPLCKDGRRIPF